MKNFIKHQQIKALFLFLVTSLVGMFSQAQDITGQWNGVLIAQGMDLRIIFHINKTNEGYSSTMDSPYQDLFGISVTTTMFDGSKLSMAISPGQSYEGEFKTDSIVGRFVQGVLSLPLTLKRVDSYARTSTIVSDQLARRDFYTQSNFFSILYTGRIPESYPNIIYSGSPFLHSAEFIQCDLSYNGNLYEKVFLNLNAHKEQLYILYVDETRVQRITELDPFLVDYFILKGEKFLYYHAPERNAIIPSGYYALLREGTMTVMRRTVKWYQESLNRVERKVIHSFLPRETYVLIHNEALYRLTGKKSLLTILHEHQKEMRKFIRNEHLRFNKPEHNPGDAYVRCVAFYETLINLN